MLPSNTQTRRRLVTAFSQLVISVLVASMASLPGHAAPITWDGGFGGSDGWSKKKNWNNQNLAGGDDLFFGGTTRLTNTNDTAATTNYVGITFNSGAGAFTLGGNSITLGGNVTNNSANLQTIDLAMILSATRTFNTASGNLAIGGVISGATFGITKTGSGNTLTLTGASTYSGTTTITAGTLQLGNGTTGNDGTITNSLSIVNSGSLVYNRFGSTSYGGVISGNGTVTKSGNGMQTLTGTNTYTGVTTINAGTLSVATIGNGGVAGNLGAATNAAANLVLGGGTLQYTGATASTDRNFTLTPGTTGTFDITTNNLTISGASTNTTGALTKIGAGTLTLSGANLYTGLTTVSNGTLSIGSGSTTGSIANTSGITNNASLIYNRSDAITVGYAISGSGTVTKQGTGTTTLTGANTYAGTTTISAGTLRVNGSHTGGGLYTVGAAGTLGGTGSTVSALSVSGVLSPGATIESFESGAITFNNGSTFAYEVDSSAALGLAADLQIVNGNLSLTSVTNLTLADLAGGPAAFANGTTFTLLNYSGTWNNGLFTYNSNAIADDTTFVAGLNTWRLDYDATSGGSNFSGQYLGGSSHYVNIVAVPEPGTIAMLVSAAALGFCLLRRRISRGLA